MQPGRRLRTTLLDNKLYLLQCYLGAIATLETQIKSNIFDFWPKSN